MKPAIKIFLLSFLVYVCPVESGHWFKLWGSIVSKTLTSEAIDYTNIEGLKVLSFIIGVHLASAFLFFIMHLLPNKLLILRIALIPIFLYFVVPLLTNTYRTWIFPAIYIENSTASSEAIPMDATAALNTEVWNGTCQTLSQCYAEAGAALSDEKEVHLKTIHIPSCKLDDPMLEDQEGLNKQTILKRCKRLFDITNAWVHWGLKSYEDSELYVKWNLPKGQHTHSIAKGWRIKRVEPSPNGHYIAIVLRGEFHHNTNDSALYILRASDGSRVFSKQLNFGDYGFAFNQNYFIYTFSEGRKNLVVLEMPQE